VNALGARHREIARIARLLNDGGGLLDIYGPDAQEAIDVTAAALNAATDLSFGIVDLDACANDDEVAERTASAVAGTLLGDPRLLHVSADRRSPRQQSAWFDMQRQMGPAFEQITSGWRRVLPGDAADIIAAAVGAFGRSEDIERPTLVLYGADSLIDVPRTRFSAPNDLLWAIRSAAQVTPDLRLVVVGGPATIELVSDSEHAFYGWGRPFELARLGASELTEELAREFSLSQSYARRVADFSDGLPRVAWALADRLIRNLRSPEPSPGDPPEDMVQSAWTDLLGQRSSELRVTIRLLADLHRAALPVCKTLSEGGAPYTAAHSGEVTRALKLLHARGICESPAPRTWRLTDPLLSAWLREQRSPGV
jgi:hypothetical protein